MPLPRRTHQQHRTTTGDNTIRRRGRCPHRPGGGQSQNCTHFRRKRKTFCRGGRLCPPDGQPQIFHCVSQKRSCVIRVDVGIDPYKRGAYLHRCIHFCGCVPPGGQGRPPLRVHLFPHRCIQFCNCIPPLCYDELRKKPFPFPGKAFSYAFGIVTVMLVPCPGVLWRAILPLWYCTACLTMESPSPVPPEALEWLLSTR